MKFDLFGFSISKNNQYVSVLSVMLNGRDEKGNLTQGLTRHLFFVSHDPIGWRFQLFFRIFFFAQYERRYMKYLFNQKYPNGIPKPTGGLKAKEAKQVQLKTEPESKGN